MLHPDPASWGPLVWALHALAVVYLTGFFVAWAHFRRLERRIRDGSVPALVRFNGDLRRFPWSFYGKMLGRHVYGRGAAPAGRGAARQGEGQEPSLDGRDSR